MSIFILGGTVVDLIFPRLTRLPAWPKHSEFSPTNLVLVREAPIVTLGGNGANAAYVAARCGATVTLETNLGNDPMGQMARRWLEDTGCRVIAPSRNCATACNVTAANAKHERATFFYAGDPVALRSPTSLPRKPKYALVCGWPHPPLDMLAASVRQMQESKIFTALDAGPILGRPWTMKALSPVLASLDLFLANEYELRRITNQETLPMAIARLRRSFAGHIVVKRGPKGALWIPPGTLKPHAIPGRRVKTLNTVGAGDSFNGALLAGLAHGASFPSALEAACTVAAGVVSSGKGVLGAAPHIFHTP